MLALIVAIAFSAVANGWIGGAFASWQVFLPSAAVFFFIVLNVTTIRRLKILTLAAVGSCLIVVVEALCGYYGGFHGDMFVLQQTFYRNDGVVGQVARLRGAGFLNDPNDFAQILIIALPLVSIAWQKRRGLARALIVFIPAVMLLWALYLTHSRGAFIALALLALTAAKRRLGNTASVVLTACLVLVMVALDFTGDRGISLVEGADRVEAWSSGLQMFKSAPLFGVGFGNFTNFNDITAHNSFVLCLAELGIVGSTIWVGLLVTTTLSLNRILKMQEFRGVRAGAGDTENTNEAASFAAGLCLSDSFSTEAITATNATDVGLKAELTQRSVVPEHWPVAMRLALIGFMATSWFLSRSYQTPMYLIVGLATATIGLQRPSAQLRLRNRWVFPSLAVEAVAIMVIYGIGQLRH
jgi:O-antigen ligase